jgi:hypothetical protein
MNLKQLTYLCAVASGIAIAAMPYMAPLWMGLGLVCYIGAKHRGEW